MADIYPNAPLVQTIFQARFPGETSIESARSSIQRALRDRFPKLYVPTVVIGVAPALQPYVFKSPDESEAVEVAINSFAYTTSKYPGYAIFRQRVLGAARAFTEHAPEVRKLNRVGLRYVNRIPILRESKEAAIPIADYLNVGLRLPESIPGANLSELNCAFTVQMDGGNLKVLLKSEQAGGPQQPDVLVLDFDFAQLRDLTIDKLDEYLDRAHSHTKQVFTDLVSRRYLPVMEGKVQ